MKMQSCCSRGQIRKEGGPKHLRIATWWAWWCISIAPEHWIRIVVWQLHWSTAFLYLFCSSWDVTVGVDIDTWGINDSPSITWHWDPSCQICRICNCARQYVLKSTDRNRPSSLLSPVSPKKTRQDGGGSGEAGRRKHWHGQVAWKEGNYITICTVGNTSTLARWRNWASVEFGVNEKCYPGFAVKWTAVGCLNEYIFSGIYKQNVYSSLDAPNF